LSLGKSGLLIPLLLVVLEEILPHGVKGTGAFEGTAGVRLFQLRALGGNCQIKKEWIYTLVNRDH